MEKSTKKSVMKSSGSKKKKILWRKKEVNNQSSQEPLPLVTEYIASAQGEFLKENILFPPSEWIMSSIQHDCVGEPIRLLELCVDIINKTLFGGKTLKEIFGKISIDV